MATTGAAGKDSSGADDPRQAPPVAADAALALMAGVVIGWLAILLVVLRLAALAPESTGKLLVLFPPGSAETKAFAAILAAGGVPVRPLLGGLGWIAYDETANFVARLEANGALAAYSGAPVGLSLAGCFAFGVDQPHPLARTLDPRLAAGSR